MRLDAALPSARFSMRHHIMSDCQQTVACVEAASCVVKCGSVSPPSFWGLVRVCRQETGQNLLTLWGDRQNLCLCKDCTLCGV